METGVEHVRQLEQTAQELLRSAPRYVFRALAKGVYEQGKDWLADWRATMPGKFKTGGKKVAKAFKVYTTGDNLAELELHVFTMWDAAEIYEKGGTIRAGKGRFLMVPVNPRAYTPTGRVKRSWRNPVTGEWAKDKTADLFAIPARGGVLLVRPTKQVTSAGVARRSGVNVGQFRAMEPMFLLIKATSRRAVLDFFAGFQRLAQQDGGIQQALEAGVRAWARDN